MLGHRKLNVMARHPIVSRARAQSEWNLTNAAPVEDAHMHALFWIGLVVLALGILAYLVVKAAIWFGIILFIAGIVLMIWGAMKVKRAV